MAAKCVCVVCGTEGVLAVDGHRPESGFVPCSGPPRLGFVPAICAACASAAVASFARASRGTEPPPDAAGGRA